MYIALHVKWPLFLSDFNETVIFSTDFRKIIICKSFMKIHAARTELFHVGRRTDRYDEANGRFSQFWESD
jgi:hypothetical protein